VVITVGLRRIPSLAEPVSSSAAGEVLLRYAKRHPRAIRGLSRFTGCEVDGSDADYVELGRQLLFVPYN
jgi:hypothetical protein